MGWTFTNEAGTELDIDDGSTYIVDRALAGIGLPLVNVRDDIRARSAGSILRSAQVSARTLTLPVRVGGSSVSNHIANVEALIDQVSGSYGREEPRFGVLKYTRPDASVRSLRCVGIEANRSGRNRITGLISRLMLKFYADHPWWYDPTEDSGTITIGTGAAVTWPVTWPVTWGLDGQGGSVEIVNDGSAETRSLKWSVPGPVVSPALFNLTTGGYVRFTGLTVPDGLTLTVRMGWRPDGISEHKAVMVDVGGDETNVLGWLDSGSNFFRLDPGTNLIEATQTNEAATVHTVEWFNEYLAA